MSKDHSDEELASGLVHWAYELETCIECALAVEQLGQGLLHKAALESHLVHGRALAGFLIGKKTWPDDMHCTDLGPEWEPEPSDAVERIASRLKDINKHLAHLTWARMTDVEPIAWTCREMAEDILSVARAWSEHVAQANRTPLAKLLAFHVRSAEALLTSNPPVEPGELVSTTN